MTGNEIEHKLHRDTIGTDRYAQLRWIVYVFFAVIVGYAILSDML